MAATKKKAASRDDRAKVASASAAARKLGETIRKEHSIHGEVDMAFSLDAISQLVQGMGLSPEYGALSLALVAMDFAGGPSGLRQVTDHAIEFVYRDAIDRGVGKRGAKVVA